MGASAHPSASGMPPKTRGCRARARLSDVEDGAGSDTGTPGHNGEETSLGEGGPETLGGRSGGDPLPRSRPAGRGNERPGDGGRGVGRQGRQDVGRGGRTPCRGLPESPPSGALRAARPGGGDPHVGGERGGEGGGGSVGRPCPRGGRSPP